MQPRASAKTSEEQKKFTPPNWWHDPDTKRWPPEIHTAFTLVAIAAERRLAAMKQETSA